MNQHPETQYARIQQAKDRAAILVALVNADARAMQAPEGATRAVFVNAAENYRQSRAALWALLEPAAETA